MMQQVNGENTEAETILSLAIQDLEDLRDEQSHDLIGLHSRLSRARQIMTSLNAICFFTWPSRYQDQLFVAEELQNIAYHDADHGGAQDIAQFCVRAYLQMLAHGPDPQPEVLTGEEPSPKPPTPVYYNH